MVVKDHIYLLFPLEVGLNIISSSEWWYLHLGGFDIIVLLSNLSPASFIAVAVGFNVFLMMSTLVMNVVSSSVSPIYPGCYITNS